MLIISSDVGNHHALACLFKVVKADKVICLLISSDVAGHQPVCATATKDSPTNGKDQGKGKKAICPHKAAANSSDNQ